MSDMNNFQVGIIGGGPAGYTAAEAAAKAGLSVILFEKDNLGGVCLNEGCIPTKTLLYSAKVKDMACSAAKYGVECAGASADMKKIMSRKSKIIRKLVLGIKARLTAHNVQICSVAYTGVYRNGGYIMRIGIRAHDVAYAPLDELIPNIHKQGFHCMHIALSKSIKEFKPGVETMTPGLAMYIKELCTENKVDVAVLGCYLNLCNPNPEKHKEIVEKYKAHIRFASILGCGVVGTETGAVNEEYKYEPANHSDEALQCFIDNLRPIVKYAEQFGVIVAIEPVWKHIVNTVERARKVLDAIDSPNLQIIFDPVNLLYVGNIDKQDEIIEKAFDLLLKDIAVVHCKDYVVEGDELKSIAAGTGGLNYPLLLKKIKEYKPYVHCTLENTVPENAVATREFMEKLYAEV